MGFDSGIGLVPSLLETKVEAEPLAGALGCPTQVRMRMCLAEKRAGGYVVEHREPAERLDTDTTIVCDDGRHQTCQFVAESKQPIIAFFAKHRACDGGDLNRKPNVWGGFKPQRGRLRDT